MRITMTEKKMIRKAGTKTVWIVTETKIRDISEYEYINIVGSSPFFRRLGGSEYTERAYTGYGYRIVRLLSTRPDREARTERLFDFA